MASWGGLDARNSQNNENKLVGGFKDLLFSTPILGEMIQFDEHIFFEMGWFNHQLALHFLLRIFVSLFLCPRFFEDSGF